MARKAVKVVVVDERPGMGLAASLAELPGVRVCAEVGTAAEAIEAVETFGPHYLVLDLSLPRLGGLGLVKALTHLHPELAVLAVSPEGSRQRALVALKAGARAFLLREGAAKAFQAAIKDVQAGRPHIDGRLVVSPRVLRPRRRLTTPA